MKPGAAFLPRSPGSRAITCWQRSYAKYPGARHPWCLFILRVCVRGRGPAAWSGRQSHAARAKRSGGWESGAEGALRRLKAPEKASALGSQRESPCVPPALLLRRELVL